MKKRFYEDLSVGDVKESSQKTISKEEILDFAGRYDPQYFHADEEAAMQSRFGEVIASGIQVMAIWRVLDHEIAQDIAWICGVAWDDVRFSTALRAGDTVIARSEIFEKRISNSDPTRGVLKTFYTLVNQDDEIVWSCISTNLVERRDAPDSAVRKTYHR